MHNNTITKLIVAKKTHAVYLHVLLSTCSKRMQFFVINKPVFVVNYQGSTRSATITIIVKTQGHFPTEKVAAGSSAQVFKKKNTIP